MAVQSPIYPTVKHPHVIVAGDFNNDKHLDLLVASETDSSISVLLGNGDGTFRSPANYTVGKEPQRIAVGDFNRDVRRLILAGPKEVRAS